MFSSITMYGLLARARMPLVGKETHIKPLYLLSLALVASWTTNIGVASSNSSPPTFALYETLDNTPNGTPSENGPVVDISAGGTLPSNLDAYVVLTETSDTSNHSLSNWSDVLHFAFTGGDSPTGTVRLFSDPAFDSLPVGDISSDVGPVFWIPETSPPTQFSFTVRDVDGEPIFFDARFAVYRDAPEVPVPATLLLLGSGLAGLGTLAWRRRR